MLEGGGMRGMFTCGVIDVMMEHGVEWDGIAGVSAGSNFGCNYKSRQPGRALRYNLRFGRDPRYMGWRCLLRTGSIISGEFAYHTVPTQYDVFDGETFAANPMEFIVVCTDVATGRPVYSDMREVTHESLEWLRASASMPLVSRPVAVDDGRLMLDGGISDSIPLKYMLEERGYEHCTVVLTQPRDYRKRQAPRWLGWLLRRQPAIADAMMRRHEMYNAQLDYIDRMEAAGQCDIIAPGRPLKIGRLDADPGRMKAVYDMGRRAGEAWLKSRF